MKFSARTFLKEKSFGSKNSLGSFPHKVTWSLQEKTPIKTNSW